MNIYGLTYAQLENYLTSIGEKKSKAPFIFQSLYRTQVTSLMDVSEINQRLKTQLADTFTVTLPQLVDKTDGTDTVKFLFALFVFGFVKEPGDYLLIPIINIICGF